LSGTAEVAQVLTAAGCVYLGAAALGQRAAAWPLFAGTFVVIGAGFAAPGFDPLWAMVGMVAVLGTIGLVRGMLRPRWGMPLQAGAMAVIIGVAIAVTLVDQRWTGVLVGAGSTRSSAPCRSPRPHAAQSPGESRATRTASTKALMTAPSRIRSRIIWTVTSCRAVWLRATMSPKPTVVNTVTVK
jgi:hypothetical protein